VLPDEASLATIIALELSHVVLGHRIDGQTISHQPAKSS